MTSWRARALPLAAAAFLAVSGIVRGLGPDPGAPGWTPGDDVGEPTPFDPGAADEIAAEAGNLGEAVPAAPAKRPSMFWTSVVTGATLAGAAYNSFSDGPSQTFHFTDEQYFGRHTYAGGADKASHFVSYYIVARLLSGVYEHIGFTRPSSLLLGSAVSFFAGFVTELGDGRGRYGFSHEDLLFDALGAATHLGLAHYGLDDMIGFSAGLVPAPRHPCCPYGGFGKDYSREIYSADFRIAGLGRRAGFNPGPARFLLLSTTYSSRGYPYAAPEQRQRQIGAFVGINFVEILRAAGMPRDPWWGKAVYFLFEVIRIPYTQIGVQYDLNHKQWSGPTIGGGVSFSSDP